MSDVSPYGVTQNPDADAITANEMVGERVSPVVGDSLAGSSAAGYSTAPYIPPRLGKCIGKGRTCEARPLKGTDLCFFHSQAGYEPPATA